MTGKQVKKIAISSSVGSGIGILIAALFIFAMAAVLAIGDIPAMLISPATVVILAFGGFCGGFCSAGFSHEKGLFCGAFSGFGKADAASDNDNQSDNTYDDNILRHNLFP